MGLKRVVCGFLLSLLIASPVLGTRPEIEVTFINPGVSDPHGATGSFWVKVSDFMQAAANDLNIHLEIIYAERNRILMKEEAFKVLHREKRPDYLIVVNEMVQAGPIVELAERRKTNIFLAFNSFTGQQSLKYGVPREKYHYWIGSLVPDNRLAGYMMAQRIIAQAALTHDAGASGPDHMIAIAGDHVTQASIERVAGLNQFLEAHPEVILQQTFVAYWRKDNARTIVAGAFDRYPLTNTIWCANDPIALGAVDAVRAEGKIPGRQIFISGLNWSLPALSAVKKGTLATSVGGHFMTGGWALVLLHDYHHGKDFADEGVAMKKKIFSAIDKKNVDMYLNKFSDQKWDKIDFRKFSKICNPAIKTYDFCLQRILQQ